MADDDGGGVSLPPSASDGDLLPDVLSEEGSGSDACSPCPALLLQVRLPEKVF